jgi:hypothetical protein
MPTMTWRRQKITPYYLPVGEDGLTYDPGIVVETRRVDDLASCPIWGVAQLTTLARRDVPPLLRDAWHVRRLGAVDPVAVVVRVGPHLLHGRVLSTAPERATITRADRLLVVLPDLVLTVHGSDPARALGRLADWIAGTRPRPRLRARPAKGPADDLNALSRLAL